jgi:hypothetical protein
MDGWIHTQPVAERYDGEKKKDLQIDLTADFSPDGEDSILLHGNVHGMKTCFQFLFRMISMYLSPRNLSCLVLVVIGYADHVLVEIVSVPASRHTLASTSDHIAGSATAVKSRSCMHMAADPESFSGSVRRSQHGPFGGYVLCRC